MNYRFLWNAKFSSTEQESIHAKLTAKLTLEGIECDCGRAQASIYGSVQGPGYTAYVHCDCGKTPAQKIVGT